MKRRVIPLLMLLTLLPFLSLVAVVPAQASYTQNEGIHGYVYECGQPKAGLTVTVTRLTGPGAPVVEGTPNPTTTDSNGYFQILAVYGHGETYQVDVETPWGSTLTKTVTVDCGQIVCVNFNYCCEFEGFTPGFWKNIRKHGDEWTGYAPGDSLQAVFGANAPDVSLLEGLSLPGGDGVEGAKGILSRAAVAALLNAAHPGINYPLTEAEVIAQVTAAFDSLDRPTMLTLADTLDVWNNLSES